MEPSLPPDRPVCLAVEGCCHGDLDRIYEVVSHLQSQGHPIELLLSCGDFQALRDYSELPTLAAPPKYQTLKDFPKYWTGAKKAPVTTVFVGGNHESPSHLRELYYGGWAAEGIYYMGHTGVVQTETGLRIAGLSGIYKKHDYHRGHFEANPYDENTKRSAYHVRRFEIEKLERIQSPVDIVMSHDWPEGITDYGRTAELLRKKDRTGLLRKDIDEGTLGNPHSMRLLKKLRPKFWFSSHMHIKYTALVPHEDGSFTRFLALDKCLPGRDFLQVLWVNRSGLIHQANIPIFDNPNMSRPLSSLYFDEEWLGILKANNDLIPLSDSKREDPRENLTMEGEGGGAALQKLAAAEESEVEGGRVKIPFFGKEEIGEAKQRRWLCRTLGMKDVLGEMESVGPHSGRINAPEECHGEAGGWFIDVGEGEEVGFVID